jgi:hypothetical protein
MIYSERAGRGLLDSLSHSLEYMKVGVHCMIDKKMHHHAVVKDSEALGSGPTMDEMRKGSFKCITWALSDDEPCSASGSVVPDPIRVCASIEV